MITFPTPPRRCLRQFALTASIAPIAMALSAHAASIDWTGPVSLTINPVFAAGLHEGRLAAAFDLVNPNPNTAITLFPVLAQTNAKPPWGDNETWVYTGEINAGPNGTLSFAEQIDDNTQIKIDGAVVLQDTVFNVVTQTGVLNFSPNSYHTFELRIGNGIGGAGPVVSNGFNATYGFGFSQTGATGLNGAAYTKPADPGDGSVFRFLVTPVGGDDIHVKANTTVTLLKVTDDKITENSIRFEPAAGTLTLTVNSDMAGQSRTLRSLATTLSITAANKTYTINGSADFAPGALSSGAAGTTTVTLIKNGGTGHLILDNPTNSLPNTVLRVIDGTVSIVGSGGTANPVSTMTAPIEIGPTSASGTPAPVLRFGSTVATQSTTFTNGIKVNNNTSSNGTIEHISASSDTISGGVAIPASRTLTVKVSAGQLNFTGAVAGVTGAFSTGGTLRKTGLGTTLRLSGITNLTTLNVTEGRVEVLGAIGLKNDPVIAAGATLALRSPSGNDLSFNVGGVISVPSGTLDGVPGAFGDETHPLNLTGGTLRLSGSTGLNGSFYNIAPPNVNNTNPNFTDFATYDASFAALGAPTVSTLTSANSVEVLSFNPTAADAAMFSVYGFAANNNIISRMKGKIAIPITGTYTFGAASDDGSMIYIDGATVVSNNFFRGITRVTGSVTLTAGTHDIDIGYFEGAGGNGLFVDWAGPGIIGTQLLPNSVLFPGGIPAAFVNPVTIVQDSTITGGALASILESLTVNAGKTLTTNGNGLTVNALAFDGGVGTYNFNTANDVTVLALSDGGAPVAITKTGTGTLILDEPASPQLQTAGSTITLNQGAIGLVLGGTNNPKGEAALVFNGGGVVLSSKSGDQIFATPDFSNGGVLSARQLGSGLAGTVGAPININVTGNLNVGAGKTLLMSTADNYVINIEGVASGTGTLAIDSGVVNASTATAVQGLTVSMSPATGITATLNLLSDNPTVGGLGGGGFGGTAAVVVGTGTGGTATLTLTGAGTSRFGGAINEAAGTTLSVVKNGSGTQALAGESNFSGGVTVNSGILEFGKDGSPGTGTITLNGGTLQFGNPGLRLKIYDSDPNATAAYGGILNTIDGVFSHFNALTPAIQTFTSSALNGQQTISYNPSGDAAAPFSVFGSGDADTIEALFVGKFNAAVAGVYNFDPRSDDGTNIFIDGVLVVNNNFPQGIGHVSRAQNVTLTAGMHDFVMTFNEGIGGAGMYVNYTPPGGFAQLLTNGTTNAPILSTTDFTATNPLILTSSSSLDLRGGNVNLGTLTQPVGSTLSLTAGTVTFSDIIMPTGGTYSFDGAGSVGFSQITDGGNAVTLNRTGGGDLILGLPLAPPQLTGAAIINVSGGSAVVAVGDFGNNPLGNAVVNLSGNGGLKLSSGGTSVDYANVVNLTGNGSIAAGNFGGGAVNGPVDINLLSPVTVGAGNTLTVSSNSNYTLGFGDGFGTGGIGGAGSVAMTGGIVRLKESVTLTGTGQLAVTGGKLTADMNLTANQITVTNGTLESFGNLTAAAGLQVNSKGRLDLNGGVITGPVSINGGAINAVSGTTDLTGNTLTIAASSTATTPNALRASLYLATGQGINNDFGINETLPGLTPAASANVTLPIDVSQSLNADGTFTTLFGGTVPGAAAFTAVAVGNYTANATGIHQFGITGNDDTAVFWFDLNHNGLFETTGSAGNELLVNVGCCNQNVLTDVRLIAGETYQVLVAVEDTGGQSGLVANFTQNGFTNAIIAPGAGGQAGIWSYDTVTGGGTLNVAPFAQMNAGVVTNGRLKIDSGGVFTATRLVNSEGVQLIGGAGFGGEAKLDINAVAATTSTVDALTAAGTVGTASIIDLDTNSTMNVTYLAVSEGATLLKQGEGTLNVTDETLGIGSLLEVQGGTVNLTGEDAANRPNGGNGFDGSLSVVNAGSALNVNSITLASLNIGDGAVATLTDTAPLVAAALAPNPAQAVPEPGSVSLLMVGALGFLRRRRRHQGA